jgi:hypothetical protein
MEKIAFGYKYGGKTDDVAVLLTLHPTERGHFFLYIFFYRSDKVFRFLHECQQQKLQYFIRTNADYKSV